MGGGYLNDGTVHADTYSTFTICFILMLVGLYMSYALPQCVAYELMIQCR